MWRKLAKRRPTKSGLYWVYLPGCYYKNGVVYGYWDGVSFGFPDAEDYVTHWMEIKRPGIPKFR